MQYTGEICKQFGPHLDLSMNFQNGLEKSPLRADLNVARLHESGLLLANNEVNCGNEVLEVHRGGVAAERRPTKKGILYVDQPSKSVPAGTKDE